MMRAVWLCGQGHVQTRKTHLLRYFTGTLTHILTKRTITVTFCPEHQLVVSNVVQSSKTQITLVREITSINFHGVLKVI